MNGSGGCGSGHTAGTITRDEEKKRERNADLGRIFCLGFVGLRPNEERVESNRGLLPLHNPGWTC